MPRLYIGAMVGRSTAEHDRVLVDALQQGDDRDAAAALEQLVRTYRDGLFNYIAHMLRSPQDVDDLLQELFARVWMGRRELSVDISLRAYLYRAARNRALDHLARRKTAARVEIDDPHADAADQFDVAFDVESRELTDVVRDAINHLPPRCREIFVLARQNGMSYPEIAETLGVSVGTVKTQMSRAVHTLLEIAKPFLVATLVSRVW